MSSSKAKVPDAWDDDWEALADKEESAPTTAPPLSKKLTKAERRAQHAEFNKQLWQAAETPSETPMFVEARSEIPLKTDMKPGITLLSRKPPPKVLTRDPKTQNAEDDEDSEEETRKKRDQEFAERQARAQREREEKQRKYAEVRERLFGSPTPEGSQERSSSRNSGNRNFRAKSRKGGDSDVNSSADQSPARGQANPKRQLYDPTHSAKSSASRPESMSRSETPNNEQQPIRSPRGPDSSGRGGFAPRGRGFS
ncbi:uncharacterized protein IWZ02DRAFT_369887 [Phyllosticta citriasiana]|uniref:uncharacterized protein n=1 Tax=Phyllosticta citriasiana TaxID=595635 RepID=UPI0030FD793E